ncbi:hypothetical protein [Roseobacter sp. OBYS 0001]|uniref:hypothetical protein n=1 Tax=Roseobacter sp. OBYS 0001 TaxID=882651 RepID=UPI001BC1900B|nr:hypothetical protein [Roseobacter sp. OBYS 0001]GIT86173.1 hypothetical protein ROBYS_11890 [Roseobacter sp. OBYS 0001]
MIQHYRERLARAGALHSPTLCSQWLHDRVDRATRRTVMLSLFPEQVREVA